MVVVWGTRFMGKVDAVPGVGHVATRFFYLQFVPLIPIETYLVYQEVGEQVYGVKIPLSIKSVLVTWLRTACILGTIGLSIFGFVQIADMHTIEGVLGLVMAVMLVAAFIYSYYFAPIAKAGYDRAMQLARYGGLGAEQLLALEIAYGRMNADQADRELARLYEQAQKADEAQQALEARVLPDAQPGMFTAQ